MSVMVSSPECGACLGASVEYPIEGEPAAATTRCDLKTRKTGAYAVAQWVELQQASRMGFLAALLLIRLPSVYLGKWATCHTHRRPR